MVDNEVGINVLEIRRGASAAATATAADIGTDEEPPRPRKKNQATVANHGSFVTSASPERFSGVK